MTTKNIVSWIAYLWIEFYNTEKCLAALIFSFCEGDFLGESSEDGPDYIVGLQPSDNLPTICQQLTDILPTTCQQLI